MSADAEATCRVCGKQSAFAFAQKVIGLNVDYFDCSHCGYVQTESPYWLSQAYDDPIDEMDTGIMWRNRLNVSRVLCLLAALGMLNGRVLDHAGGYGILVRMLRDAGIEAHWNDKYCLNILSRGFEADDDSYDLVTAFEVFEHLEYPLQELEGMLTRAPHALVSTELIVSRQTPESAWWYYGPEHGQHIGFFREATLAHLARRLGCYYQTDGRSLHFFSKLPVPRMWNVLRHVLKAGPLIARFRLHSKVWSDFESIRVRRNGI